MNPWEGFALSFAITGGILAATLVVVLVLWMLGAFDRADDEEPVFFDEEDTRPYDPGEVDLAELQTADSETPVDLGAPRVLS